MANFQTHIAVAALGSMTATAICIQKTSLSDEQALILFILGCIAGMLPDIDSKHSIPAKWFFRSITMTALLTVAFYSIPKFSILYVLSFLLITFLVTHFILANIIKSMTSHRGLFHSVPTAGLFGVGMYLIGHHTFNWSEYFSVIAAIFVTGGYLLHLLLDEYYSVDLMGRKLKKSFGSALTFFNIRQWRGYMLLYLILGCTGFYAYYTSSF